MINIGQPAASIVPGMLPPAPPTMQIIDQQGTPQTPQATDSTNTNPVAPIGGASLGDMLAAKGQSLPTVTSPSLTKLNDGLNQAAQTKAASATPPKPGDWARQLVSGAQSMLGTPSAQSTASSVAGAVK